jgi:hypothetical protein
MERLILTRKTRPTGLEPVTPAVRDPPEAAYIREFQSVKIGYDIAVISSYLRNVPKAADLSGISEFFAAYNPNVAASFLARGIAWSGKRESLSSAQRLLINLCLSVAPAIGSAR